MKEMLNLPVGFKVKAISDNNGENDFIVIEGYANTTTVDRVGDIILEEAWTKGGLDNYLKNPIILAYHNHTKPIGLMTEYYINNKGLKIVAKVHKSIGEIYSLIKDGVLKTFSVGFRTREADYDTETDLFVIKDLELLEVSVVSIPANADSTFSVRKSFETEDEYISFKSEFLEGTSTVIAEDESDDNSENKEEKNMPESIDKKQLETDLRAKIEKEMQEEADRKAALEEEVSTQVEKAISTTTEVVGERVENLKTEIEKRFNDESTTLQEALDSIKSEIAEYSEQLQSYNKSKMSFTDKESSVIDLANKDIDTAMLVSKILNRPVADTKFGQDLIQKAGTTSDGAHQIGMTAGWEIGFSTRLFEDVREKLIVENLFTTMTLPRATLNIPLNPEAGYGTWVVGGAVGELSAATSSGTARTHGLNDTQLTAYKLATKEFIGYEEEDDSLIPLIPIIRDAAVRRMAKSSDKALLRGVNGVVAGTGEGSYPFDGLATIGVNAGRTLAIGGTFGTIVDTVTVANLRAMRKQMGVHGHNASDIVFVVSHDVYYDLLEDTNFLTMDKVGTQATILTGQVGKVGGSAIIVSGEFESKAANKVAAICVNMSNYIKGDYKGLSVERERSVENQTNLLVVTRRMGMLELFSSNATVVTMVWPGA